MDYGDRHYHDLSVTQLISLTHIDTPFKGFGGLKTGHIKSNQCLIPSPRALSLRGVVPNLILGPLLHVVLGRALLAER